MWQKHIIPNSLFTNKYSLNLCTDIFTEDKLMQNFHTSHQPAKTCSYQTTHTQNDKSNLEVHQLILVGVNGSLKWRWTEETWGWHLSLKRPFTKWHSDICNITCSREPFASARPNAYVGVNVDNLFSVLTWCKEQKYNSLSFSATSHFIKPEGSFGYSLMALLRLQIAWRWKLLLLEVFFKVKQKEKHPG